MNRNSTPSNISDYFFLTPEDLSQQPLYQDAVAYLRMYGIPIPDLTLTLAPINALFYFKDRLYETPAVQMMFNPVPIVDEFITLGLIPGITGYLIPYIPSSRTPIKSKPADLSNLMSSIGVILNGFPTKTRSVTTPFKGKIPLDTVINYAGEDYILSEDRWVLLTLVPES